MPVVIDKSKEMDAVEKNLDFGVDLVLSEEDKQRVVMTKFITTNANRYGFEPEGEWIDQVIADVGGGRRSVRLQLKEDEKSTPRALNRDDGLIIDLVGTLTGIVGLLPGRPPMQEQDIDLYVEQTNERVPTYQQWDFRVVRARKTNGPEGRLSLTRSEEHKRLHAQTEMMEAFTKMFQTGNVQMVSKGELAASAEETLKAGMKATAK
jgi:hypothetical protein